MALNSSLKLQTGAATCLDCRMPEPSRAQGVMCHAEMPCGHADHVGMQKRTHVLRSAPGCLPQLLLRILSGLGPTCLPERLPDDVFPLQVSLQIAKPKGRVADLDHRPVRLRSEAAVMGDSNPDAVDMPCKVKDGE